MTSLSINGKLAESRKQADLKEEKKNKETIQMNYVWMWKPHLNNNLPSLPASINVKKNSYSFHSFFTKLSHYILLFLLFIFFWGIFFLIWYFIIHNQSKMKRPKRNPHSPTRGLTATCNKCLISVVKKRNYQVEVTPKTLLSIWYHQFQVNFCLNKFSTV